MYTILSSLTCYIFYFFSCSASTFFCNTFKPWLFFSTELSIKSQSYSFSSLIMCKKLDIFSRCFLFNLDFLTPYGRCERELSSILYSSLKWIVNEEGEGLWELGRDSTYFGQDLKRLTPPCTNWSFMGRQIIFY